MLNWNAICKPKCEGGLGLVPLKIRNLAFLAKWWWRAYSNRQALWNQILHLQFGHSLHYKLEEVNWKPSNSFLSKGFLSINVNPRAMNFLKHEAFKWKIVSGRMAYLWEDYWHELGPLMYQLPCMYRISLLKHFAIVFLEQWNSRARTWHLWSRPIIDRDLLEIGLLT